MKKGDLFSGSAWEIYEARVESFDVAAGEVLEKATESNKMIGLGKN